VVSVSQTLTHSFASELQRIGELLVNRGSADSPATALAKHIFKIASTDMPLRFGELRLATVATELNEAPQLAMAGYILHGSNDDIQTENWRRGLRRLSKREAFTRDHQTFVFRPAELVGIALGIAKTEPDGSALRRWLVTVLRELPAQSTSLSVWNTLWSIYAAHILEVVWPARPSLKKSDCDVCDLCLLLVFARASVLPMIPGEDFGVQELEKDILRKVLLTCVDEREVDRLSACYVGITTAAESQLSRHLSPDDGLRGSTRATVGTLQTICRQFDLFVRKLGERYANRRAFKVNDEYDVQDLMHGLLLLHFDVVIPEDAVPARAGNKSRLDFLLKKEGVVVETKMTRKSYRQSEVHDDLVADRDRYSSHPDCEVLVCFVYDPARKFHNAPAFELDLTINEGRPQLRAFVCPH
jgi:hypothetical protein